MNLANSQNNQLPRPHKALGLSLVWLGVYALLVSGLAVLFYRFLLNKMWLVPVLAEVVLIKTAWTAAPYWKGLAGRFAGLVAGNILAHFLYVIPVIYEGKEAWSEEALWAYVVVGVQTAVAAIVLAVIRARIQKRASNACRG